MADYEPDIITKVKELQFFERVELNAEDTLVDKLSQDFKDKVFRSCPTGYEAIVVVNVGVQLKPLT